MREANVRSSRLDRPAILDALSRTELLFLIALFIVAVSARIAWAYANTSQPLSDFVNYYNAAVKTAESGKLSDYAVYKGPGTVIILALWMKVFGTSLYGVFWLNALAGGVSVLATYSLAKGLSLTRAVAALSAVLVAVYPDFLSLAALVASENFALPALLLGAIAFLRVYRVEAAWRVLLLGAFIGVTLLIRPVYLLATLFVLVGFFWRPGPRWPFAMDRNRGTRALVFAAGIALIVLPWSAYASSRAKEPVLIAHYAPLAFFCAHNPFAEQGWDAGLKRVRELIPDYEESKRFKQLGEYALRYCVLHPEHLVKNIGFEFHELFREPDVQSHWVLSQKIRMYESRTDRRSLPFRDFGGSLRLSWLNLAIFGFACAGTAVQSILLLLRRQAEKSHWLVFLVANMLIYHTIAATGHPRYLTPWMPVLMILASMLTVQTYDRFVKESVLAKWVADCRYLLVIAFAVALVAALGSVVLRHRGGQGTINMSLVRNSGSDLTLDYYSRGRPDQPVLVAQPAGMHSVRFQPEVPKSGSYEIQVSCRRLKENLTISGSWDGTELPPAAFPTTGKGTSRSGAWRSLGTVQAEAGRHQLIIQIAGASVLTGVRLVPAERAVVSSTAPPGLPTAQEIIDLKGLLGPSAVNLTEANVAHAGMLNATSSTGVVFDRQIYGRPNVVMVTRVPMSSYEISFSVTASSAGPHLIYSKYSNMERRPVTLSVDQQGVTVCEERESRSWRNKDSILVRESEQGMERS